MPSRNGAQGTCGCLALFGAPRARPSASSKKAVDQSLQVNVTTEQAASEGHVVLRQQVQDLVAAEMKNLEESMSRELQSVLSRLLKADAQPASPVAAKQAADDSALPLHNRSDWRRRWTCAADGADSLSAILRRTASADAEDEDLQDDEVRARSSGDHSPLSDAELHSRKSLSFVSQPEEVHIERGLPAGSEDHTDVEENSMKSGSSVVWRIDALDCGDRLAASAAAKKGSASVDSIVELVESERERWEEEKLALEARLEDLKEQRQTFRRRPDAEKEELKRQVQELRETMKLRSRFGAWVCERHMQESDDEEESPGNLEKEELREVMATLEAELRDARAQAATASQQC